MSDQERQADAFTYGQLGSGSGFQRSSRYASSGGARPDYTPLTPKAETADPLATAFAEGFAAGMAEAQADAEQRAQLDAAARARLELSFNKLDRELADELRLRLRDTVTAMCEATIAPFAIDEDALLARIAKAVSMMQRADDERLIRLHPDDIALISDRLAAEWDVTPDPTLERGCLRVECANGGLEDGPAVWRRVIAEALQQC